MKCAVQWAPALLAALLLLQLLLLPCSAVKVQHRKHKQPANNAVVGKLRAELAAQSDELNNQKNIAHGLELEVRELQSDLQAEKKSVATETQKEHVLQQKLNSVRSLLMDDGSAAVASTPVTALGSEVNAALKASSPESAPASTPPLQSDEDGDDEPLPVVPEVDIEPSKDPLASGLQQAFAKPSTVADDELPKAAPVAAVPQQAPQMAPKPAPVAPKPAAPQQAPQKAPKPVAAAPQKAPEKAPPAAPAAPTAAAPVVPHQQTPEEALDAYMGIPHQQIHDEVLASARKAPQVPPAPKAVVQSKPAPKPKTATIKKVPMATKRATKAKAQKIPQGHVQKAKKVARKSAKVHRKKSAHASKPGAKAKARQGHVLRGSAPATKKAVTLKVAAKKVTAKQAVVAKAISVQAAVAPKAKVAVVPEAAAPAANPVVSTKDSGGGADFDALEAQLHEEDRRIQDLDREGSLDAMTDGGPPPAGASALAGKDQKLSLEQLDAEGPMEDFLSVDPSGPESLAELGSTSKDTPVPADANLSLPPMEDADATSDNQFLAQFGPGPKH